MAKIAFLSLLVIGNILSSSAFWSLETDLQLGYEIYDRSYEINAVIQAIVTAASRSAVIQDDDKTRIAVGGLQALATQLSGSPVSFFSEIAAAAASQTNNELWHVSRIRNFYANHDTALKVLLNVTGPLNDLSVVTNPFVVSAIRSSLAQVQNESSKVLSNAEEITGTITQIRANSSHLVTPGSVDSFIGDALNERFSSSLVSIRNSFTVLLLAVRDAGRLIVAHGSVHELLSRSYAQDSTTRNAALDNLVNNYNRVRNNLLLSVAGYRQTAEAGISNFISRVHSTYQDTIVRPKFDQVQLPLIQSFANIITSKVYNKTLFQASFDDMRDLIVNSFSEATNSTFVQGSQHRDEILNLQKTAFVRRYSHCLNELVTEAQETSNSITNKYAFCLNERTSGIVVAIPSTDTWLSVIRENINYILQQLNACLNGLSTVDARTATSECIQFNANNLAFYAGYLPITVESSLRPITETPPVIFQNCVSLIPSSVESEFDAILDKCKAEVEEKPTTTVTTPDTTEDSEDGSGSEFPDTDIFA